MRIVDPSTYEAALEFVSIVEQSLHIEHGMGPDRIPTIDWQTKDGKRLYHLDEIIEAAINHNLTTHTGKGDSQ